MVLLKKSAHSEEYLKVAYNAKENDALQNKSNFLFPLFIVNEKYIASFESTSLLNQLHPSSLARHLSNTSSTANLQVKY